jgi:hypothetical protein
MWKGTINHRCFPQAAIRVRTVPFNRLGRLAVYGEGDAERHLFGEVRAEEAIHSSTSLVNTALI